MPYALRKTSKGWGVINTETGKWKSKDIPKERAQRQMRLLYGIESGKWKPTFSKETLKKAASKK